MDRLTKKYTRILQKRLENLFSASDIDRLEWYTDIEDDNEYTWRFKLGNQRMNLTVEKQTKNVTFTVFLPYSEKELQDANYEFYELKKLVELGTDIEKMRLIVPLTYDRDDYVDTDYGELHVKGMINKNVSELVVIH